MRFACDVRVADPRFDHVVTACSVKSLSVKAGHNRKHIVGVSLVIVQTISGVQIPKLGLIAVTTHNSPVAHGAHVATIGAECQVVNFVAVTALAVELFNLCGGSAARFGVERVTFIHLFALLRGDVPPAHFVVLGAGKQRICSRGAKRTETKFGDVIGVPIQNANCNGSGGFDLINQNRIGQGAAHNPRAIMTHSNAIKSVCKCARSVEHRQRLPALEEVCVPHLQEVRDRG